MVFRGRNAELRIQKAKRLCLREKSIVSIGVGIIGWGAICQELHGPCIEGLEECDLVAVCDEREERLDNAERLYGAKGYREIDAFLADPSVQLVTAALPNFLHGPTSLRVLTAGKHVISEKPLSFSVSETDELIQVAKENGLIVTTHRNRRWDPDYEAVRRIRESGELGRLHMIQSRHLSGPWQKTWAPPGPIRVSGVVKSILKEDDYVNCLLTYSDGATARVGMGRASRMRHFTRFEASFECGDVRTSKASEGSWLRVRRDGEEETKERIPDPPAFPVQSHPFYKNVCATIRGEEGLIVKSEQCRRYVAVSEAIVKSSEEGVTVVVD